MSVWFLDKAYCKVVFEMHKISINFHSDPYYYSTTILNDDVINT